MISKTTYLITELLACRFYNGDCVLRLAQTVLCSCSLLQLPSVKDKRNGIADVRSWPQSTGRYGSHKLAQSRLVKRNPRLLDHKSDTVSPSPPLNNIRVMVIVWRLRGNIIRTTVCWVVWHNVHSQQHTHVSSSYRSSRLGLSQWDPYAMHRRLPRVVLL